MPLVFEAVVGCRYEADPQAWREVSASHYVGPRTPPTLTIHGKWDTISPFFMSEHLHHVLDAHNVTNLLLPKLTTALTGPVMGYHYCVYCYYYGDYCQYCFYYNDYTWLHRLWSTGVTELTPAGQPIGNQFGGSISTS